MHRTHALIGILALSVTSATASAQERMSPELLWELGRLGGGTVSSDGTLVAYSVRHYELEDNKGASTIHVRYAARASSRVLKGSACQPGASAVSRPGKVSARRMS